MKMLLIILITVAGAQGKAGQISESKLQAAQIQLNEGDGYELDLSEVCELEFKGEMNNNTCEVK